MNIPDKVINRLALYHNILDEFENDNVNANISSTQIAELLNIDDSQVRKDIKYLNNTGKCRVGYNVCELKNAIENTLGFEKTKNAFIVGAGNLGSALAKYDSFSNYGLNVLAMFDNNPIKVGSTINNKEVFHTSKLEDLAKRLNVEIAILTVPAEYAQESATFLANAGIKYIWNFTPRILNVSKDINVWNENLIGSFLQFTRNNKDTVLL